MFDLRRFWADASKPVQRFVLLLLGVGVCSIVMGMLGDAHDYWTSRPYQTNLLSAVTGASFGIPLAIVVLQRVAADQAERADRRAARQQWSRAVDALERAYGSLFRAPTATKFYDIYRQIDRVSEEASYRASQLRQTDRLWLRVGLELELKRLFGLEVLLETLEDCLVAAGALFPAAPELRKNRQSVQAALQFLEQEAATRLVATQQEPPHPSVFERLEASFGAEAFPGIHLMESLRHLEAELLEDQASLRREGEKVSMNRLGKVLTPRLESIDVLAKLWERDIYSSNQVWLDVPPVIEEIRALIPT